jgi:glucose/arabinose dehydrogenase
MRATRSRLAAAVVAAGTVCSILVTPGVAQAHSGMTTVAAGLDNPRGLAFGPDGSLYVAEAGRGGTAVSSRGKVSTVAVFPDRLVDAPPFLGLPPGYRRRPAAS